jgi:hypothetical protein
MLYIGLMEHEGKDMMYVSSVSESAGDDQFYANSRFVSFPSDMRNKKDRMSQQIELNILRNILTAGGSQVTIES